MTKRFLLVAGNIGAGKTTLTDSLASRLGWEGAYESVEGNPFLGDFYEDMRKWAFHLQIYFLGDRAEQHAKLANDPKSAIIDRSIYEDLHIFARAAHHLDNVSDREFNTYTRLFNFVVDHLPVPDLLLYLDATVETLLDRIHGRARDIESGISGEYLSLLDRYYDEWLAAFDICPVLTIPAGDLNWVNNERHIDLIIAKINEKLAGKEEVVFPEV